MNPRGPAHDEPSGAGLLSIGALSTATGIPIDTIRTWERRYGFPVPERKPSGHRVYPLAVVPRLRRAAQAIAQGHRAAEVVPASERALEALLDSFPPPTSAPLPLEAGKLSSQSGACVEDLVTAARHFDAPRLRHLLEAEWARMGPLQFMEHLAAPFLTVVGDGWAKGELDVRHEHFASGVVGDFLRAVRAPLEDRANGPVAALATLPNEQHGLGLHLAAVVFALCGWRPLVLGVDTPVEQIAALAREATLGAVALSCVQTQTRNSSASIRTLRQRMPRQIPLVIGGRGTLRESPLKGVEVIPSLVGLDHWLRKRRSA
jgi:methanogenic corrinoid protein MtbC1